MEGTVAASTYTIESAAWPGWTSSRFWGPVIAGSLFVMTFFVMSWFLMLGCRVGVTHGGMLSLSAGAGWWTGVTSAIAFYIGGAIAANVYGRGGSRYMRGAAVWSLTIPLALCVWGLASSGWFFGASGAHTGVISSGVVWTCFWSLVVGLAFAIFGGATPFTRADVPTRATRETTITNP